MAANHVVHYYIRNAFPHHPRRGGPSPGAPPGTAKRMNTSGTLSLDRPAIAALIPHAGSMCLLDRVLEAGTDHIVCTSTSHLNRDHPMRRAGRLAAACGIEYAAQAMALHGALSDPAHRRRQGFLVGLRETTLSARDLDECGPELVIEARRLFGEDNRVIYEFAVRGRTLTALQGRASVFLDAARD